MAAVELAEGICEKLEGQLTCSICLESYTDPKFLRCHHYFCLKCLSKLLTQDDRQRFVLRCPSCRTVTRIPNDNVAGLQPAFHVTGLKDIQESAKKIKDTVGPAKMKCREHGGKEVELYCETCDIPICCHCVIKSGRHCNHKYEFISDALNIHIPKIKESVIPDCKRVNENLNQLYLKLKAVVEELLPLCHAAVSLQDPDWSEFLNKKLENCVTQRTQVADYILSLGSKLTHTLEFCNDDISLEMWIALLQSYRDLASYIVDVERRIGQTQICTVLNPLKCHAVGQGLHVARIGETAAAEVYVACCTGSLQDVARESIQCELVSTLDGSEKVKCTVTKVDPNRYDMFYQLTAKGEYLLNIKADHGHIQGSPFLVTVVDVKANIMGFPIMTLYNMTPMGVAVDQKGTIIAQKRPAHGISTFSSRGEHIESFPIFNLCTLNSITTDEGENVFLASIDSGIIFKMTAGGVLIDSYRLTGRLKCISFNPCSRRIYVLKLCGCILTLTSDFRSELNYSGKHEDANALACDMSGKVYMTYSHCVKVFTAKMEFVRQFGKFGDGKGELNEPFGIAIDHRGVVFVSEMGNCRVSLFTSTGRFLTSIGRQGYGPGEFSYPRSLAVSKNGVLYVCDYNRVQAFSCKHFPYKASLSDSLPGIIGAIIAVMIAIFMIIILA